MDDTSCIHGWSTSWIVQVKCEKKKNMRLPVSTRKVKLKGSGHLRTDGADMLLCPIKKK